MKKIFLIFGLFVFSCLSVNATTVSVRYNNAGAPISVAYGYHKPISMMRAQQYGTQYHSNRPRAHRPRPYVGYGYNDGYAGPYLGMQESISEGGIGGGTHTVNVQKNISRLSKDYKKVTPAKTHTSGGITYYY